MISKIMYCSPFFLIPVQHTIVWARFPTFTRVLSILQIRVVFRGSVVENFLTFSEAKYLLFIYTNKLNPLLNTCPAVDSLIMPKLNKPTTGLSNMLAIEGFRALVKVLETIPFTTMSP